MTNKKSTEILPNAYFKELKEKLVNIDINQIKEDCDLLVNLIEDAKEMGQIDLVENYKALAITLLKERILHKNGYSTYVKQEDIERFILNVKDKVVKICELEKFPRTIPTEVKNKFKHIKKLNVCDEYYVLFIDYNKDEQNLTEKEKETRKKNRDPILFGTFKESMDRFYFIADWEDDICDITLDKMTKVLKNLDKKYEVKHVIDNPEEYLNNLLRETYKPIKMTDKIKSIFKKLKVW